MSETYERSIDFSGAMVRAILGGRKTQARMVVCGMPADAVNVRLVGDSLKFGSYDDASTAFGRIRSPYGWYEDRLWVREPWRSWENNECVHDEDDPCAPHCRQVYVAYEATPRVGYRPLPDRSRITYLDESTPLDRNRRLLGPWLPAEEMSRWASRITLEITAVRVERLQDISEEDAKAEGVQLHEGAPMCPCHGEEEDPGPTHLDTCAWRDPDYDPEGSPYRDEFAILWNSINGKKAPWSSNPWVWVLEFKRVEQEGAVVS